MGVILINKHIAVIIPAFKVENKINNVINNIPEFISTIIVINDASPDRTKDILAQISDPRLIVLEHEENMGVGGAMITGYNFAASIGVDIMVKMDGDDQMDPAQIENLITPLLNNEADFTKGNRFLHQTQLKKMPLIRRIGNLILTFFVKASSGYWQIFDPTNGFTAMHVNIWKQLNHSRIAFDYFFESSLLIELRYINSVIQDIYIPARYQDETSSLSIRKVLFTFPRKLFNAMMRRIFYQYYLYNFSFGSLALLIGITLILFGTIWRIIFWMKSINTNIPATTGTVLIAVLPIILGTQLILQFISQDMADIPEKTINRHLYQKTLIEYSEKTDSEKTKLN